MQASVACGTEAAAASAGHNTDCSPAAAKLPVAESAARTTASSSRVSDTDEQVLQLLEQQLMQGGDGATGHSDASAEATAAVWDVDELVGLGLDAGILAWSQKLDFDSYQQHWNSTAVTLGSEAAVPVSEAVLVQQLQVQQLVMQQPARTEDGSVCCI